MKNFYYLKIVLTFILLINFLNFKKINSKLTRGTVYLNNSTKKVEKKLTFDVFFKEDIEDSVNGISWGSNDDKFDKEGWVYLKIETNPFNVIKNKKNINWQTVDKLTFFFIFFNFFYFLKEFNHIVLV
jgi:hypothetical protein